MAQFDSDSGNLKKILNAIPKTQEARLDKKETHDILPLGMSNAIENKALSGTLSDAQRDNLVFAELVNKNFESVTTINQITNANKKDISDLTKGYVSMVSAWQQFYAAQAALSGTKQKFGLESHGNKQETNRLIGRATASPELFVKTDTGNGSKYSLDSSIRKGGFLRSHSQATCGQLYLYALENSNRDRLMTITFGASKMHQVLGMLAVVGASCSKPPNMVTFNNDQLATFNENTQEYMYNLDLQSHHPISVSIDRKLLDLADPSLKGKVDSRAIQMRKQVKATIYMHRISYTCYKLASMSSVMEAHAAIDVISEKLAELEKNQTANVTEGSNKHDLSTLLKNERALDVFRDKDGNLTADFTAALKPLTRQNGEENFISSAFIKKGFMNQTKISNVPRALVELKNEKIKEQKPPVYHYHKKRRNQPSRVELDFQSSTGVHSNTPSEIENKVYKCIEKYHKANTGVNKESVLIKTLNPLGSNKSIFQELNNKGKKYKDVKDTLKKREQAIEIHNALEAIDESYQSKKDEIMNNLKKAFNLSPSENVSPSENESEFIKLNRDQYAYWATDDSDVIDKYNTELSEQLDFGIEVVKQQVCEHMCKMPINNEKFNDFSKDYLIENYTGKYMPDQFQEVINDAKKSIEGAGKRAKACQNNIKGTESELIKENKDGNTKMITASTKN